MQKWEYVQLSVMYETDQRRYALNGQFKHEWNTQAIHAILNTLGDQGWELITETAAREYVFKRPKSE